MLNDNYEDKSEVKTTPDEVRMWQSEITLALESEKDWRKDAKRVLKIYRSESDDKVRKDTFNILWANTEIKRQSVINTTPIPDCRRRYGDEDVVGREVSELLNRGISYTLDCQDGLTKLIAAANDFLLVGRGELRVRYKGYMSPNEVEESEETDAEEGESPEETLDYEECQIEHVNWEEFFHGPAKEWDKVPWEGFQHDLTKEEAEKRFGEKAEKLSYTVTQSKDAKTDNSDLTIFKRTTVYEIWDKEKKRVLWLGKDYSDEFLDVIEDPMELMDFFPSPRPVYAVEDPNSLIPIIEYCQYETLAKELEDITRRLIRLVKACKVRGIYDSRLSEIEKVLEEDDNGLVAAMNSSAIAEVGGLAKAIMFLPIENIIVVINNLQAQRMAVKAMIDELNGMSDIVRGSTNPNETATAQRIKANFASARLDKQKQAFQVFARNVIRLMADVISKFKRETLTVMTGLSYPTNEEKEAAQARLQMLQQPQQQMPGMPPQQPNPQEMQQLQAVLAKPSWEDIEQVLRSDITREYRIDIETDSTMAADQQAEQEVLASFMQAMAQFTTMAAGAVQSGLMTGEAAKQIMISFTRKFRLGKDVEEELEKPLPPPQPDPAAQAAQAEMQMKQQEFQMKQQGEQQKMQFEQQKQQMEMQRMQMELEIKKEEAAMERQKMQDELQIERERLQIEREKLAMSSQQTALKGRYEQEKHSRDMQKLKEPASVA